MESFPYVGSFSAPLSCSPIKVKESQKFKKAVTHVVQTQLKWGMVKE